MALLAAPLNTQILKALESGPLPLRSLRQAIGSPPQSTMRLYTRSLDELGVIERRSRREFPTSVDYAITRSGRGLLGVAGFFETWLAQAPDKPIELGTIAARNTIKSLSEGWSTTIIRALAGRAYSLTELDRLIPRVSYPSLERRLAALRIVGLVEGHRVDGGTTPHSATDWLRRAVAPAVAAIAWEQRFLPQSSQSVGRLDVEAAFLLAIPLTRLPKDVSGRCRLAVEVQRAATPDFAGVVVRVEEGKVVSCLPNLKGEVEGWASGSPRAWLNRLMGSPSQELDLGGEIALADAIVEALRRTPSKP
ncbi:MAG TPA: winged helix-turn-helix transcriptional regulator [Solirubrobacterales bacterium]|nr:winged helix-turn-helix transcriptional regulator [Solirubrobacterales bacterium]